MIPLRDNVPSSRRPYVTYGILGLNVAVFLYQLSLGKDLGSFIDAYSVVPAAYTGGMEKGFLERLVPLFTSMFMHGGWGHIFSNMLFLWIFADNVEDRLGHVRFIFFYLLSGLAATLAHVAVNASSTSHCIGASGAIGGVLGAYMITYPRARVLVLIFFFYFIHFIEVPALFMLLLWFVIQLFSGVGSLGVDYATGVAYWAHIGGFLAGIALMLLMAPKRKGGAPRVDYIQSPRRRW